MIGYLEGKIVDSDISKITVLSGGVGFVVNTTPDNAVRLSGAEKAKVWTHMVVREDAMELYGFVDKEELAFFKILINISGIGPKTALGVLSASSIKNLKSAVASGDIAYLTKISGIGKKIAEKMIFELKEKLGRETSDGADSVRGDTDVLEALVSLGYGERDAREAIKKLPRDISGASDRVKSALKILGS